MAHAFKTIALDRTRPSCLRHETTDHAKGQKGGTCPCAVAIRLSLEETKQCGGLKESVSRVTMEKRASEVRKFAVGDSLK